LGWKAAERWFPKAQPAKNMIEMGMSQNRNAPKLCFAHSKTKAWGTAGHPYLETSPDSSMILEYRYPLVN